MSSRTNIIISGFHIERMLEMPIEVGKLSLDLGMTKSTVRVSDESVVLPDGQEIGMDGLRMTRKRRHLQDCFLVEDNSLIHLYEFSAMLFIGGSLFMWPVLVDRCR